MKAPIVILKKLFAYADLIAYIDYVKYKVVSIDANGIKISVLESPDGGHVGEGGYLYMEDIPEECVISNKKVVFNYYDSDFGEETEVLIRDLRGQNIMQLLMA